MVEWKKLGEVCEILDSQRKPVSKGKRLQGDYPYYGANGIQDYVDNYIFDGIFLLIGEDGSVINKDNSPVLHWATGKIWVNNHAHILKENNQALLRYLFYILQCTDVSDIVRGVPPKINQANMRNIAIPIPTLPEQQKIVGILDTFTASIENLKQQITERRKQYEYYRDQLLDLEGKEGVSLKALGDVCEKIVDGSHNPPKGVDYSKNLLLSSQNIRNGSIDYSGARYLSDEDFLKENKRTNVTQGDVLLTIVGTIGRACVLIGNEGNLVFQRSVAILRPKSFMNSFFLMYYLQSKEKALNSESNGGAQKGIYLKQLSKIQILFPHLAEQKRIVSILNAFEASISNLEAQLKQREKQYEYYRNKLLTFE